MEQPDKLTIDNSLDIILVLLYAQGKNGEYGEPIEGITRMQKLVFLLQQGKGPERIVQIAKECLYRAHKMGPYSDEVTENINDLISADLVKTERLRYLIIDDADGDISSSESEEQRQVESFRYSLTQLGFDVAKQLWDNLNRKEQNALIDFKIFFCSLTLRQLLIFVYEKYPNFTGKSEIKQKLGF